MSSIEKTSKRLSFLLRHSTDPLVISLDGGWAHVLTILEMLHIKRSELDEIVRTDRKTATLTARTGSVSVPIKATPSLGSLSK